MSEKIKLFTETAVIAAICFALSFVPIQFGPGNAFDISLGLIPLSIFGLRRGLVPCLSAGFLWSMLKIITGQYFLLTPSQWIFDYLLAFTAAGFFGALSWKIKAKFEEGKNANLLITLTAFIGVFARWIFHFFSGYFVWGEYAPESWNPFLYSLVFNGASFIANLIMLVIVLLIIGNSKQGRWLVLHT
jgi:thiamine transporter